MMRDGSLAVSLLVLGSLVSAAGAEAEDGNSWSGYILKGATFTAVSAMWTQPTVACTTKDARVSIWVGLDGNGTPTVEQVGTVAVCGKTSATPLYYKAFWEMYTSIEADKQSGEPFLVSPGDTITASVSYNNGSYTLKFEDVTSGRYFSQPANCRASIVCQRATAEWIVERPGGGKYPLADYAEAVFYKWGYDRSSSEGAAGVQINMVDQKTKRLLSHCRFFDAGQPSGTPPQLPPLVVPKQIQPPPDLGCSWVAAE